MFQLFWKFEYQRLIGLQQQRCSNNNILSAAICVINVVKVSVAYQSVRFACLRREKRKFYRMNGFPPHLYESKSL